MLQVNKEPLKDALQEHCRVDLGWRWKEGEHLGD